MTQTQVIDALHEIFPDGYYPPNQLYNILKKSYGWTPDVIKKQRGILSTVAWMKTVGFEPLEAEMQPRSDTYITSSDSANILDSLHYEAFVVQPLLGNVNPTQEQRDYLHGYARNALVTAINNKLDITDCDCDIVILETVLLLQNWNDDDENDESEDNESTSFWEYIYNQYAIPYQAEGFVGSVSYRIFRHAIIQCLEKHNRLMAKSGHRYYTTLLTHALAPKSKFFALFEQVFYFYSKSLQYQFIEEDTAFSAFSFAMKKRFDGEVKNTAEDVYIKSLQSSSAIRLLFKSCPYYMGNFVKEIARGIDILVSTGNLDDTTYINTLLKAWYKKRTHDMQIRDRSERQIACANHVETDYSRIRLSYQLKSDKVVLIVPSIRLGELSSDSPTVTIYQEDKCVYRENLRWFGDRYCITSNKTEIAYDCIVFDATDKINLRVAISYANEVIYCSDDKMFRNAIIFDNNGIETTKRPSRGEIFYVYAATNATVDDDGLADSPQCEILPNKAQLYRVMMGDNTRVIVNGVNLFPNIVTTEDLCIEMPTMQIKNVIYIFERQEYNIFNECPCLMVLIQKGNDKQYRVVIDNQHSPLATFKISDTEGYVIPLSCGDETHEAQIIDNTTNYVVFDLKYVVIESFDVIFYGYHSVYSTKSGSLAVVDEKSKMICPYKILGDGSEMYLPYHQGELRVDVPTLICRLDSKALSTDETRVIWYKDIPMSARLEIEPPRGYAVAILVGSRAYEYSQIELGNILMASNHETITEDVGIILSKNGVPTEDIKLLSIAFEPCFEMSPILFEDDQLLWCPEDNFIGDKHLRFMLYLYRKNYEIARYSLTAEDEVIESLFPFGDGIFKFAVKIKEPGFFSSEENQIYDGKLVVGDLAEIRFDGQAVIVTDALFENEKEKNEKIILKTDSGVITNLKYKGNLQLNGEKLLYPCYEGCLKYKRNGLLRSYTDHEYEYNGIKHEQINPVQLWVINEYTIALRNPDNEGLYINKAWESITDRQPEKYNKKDYCISDYYLYEVVEGEQSNV